jgi:hypothetical protein
MSAGYHTRWRLLAGLIALVTVTSRAAGQSAPEGTPQSPPTTPAASDSTEADPDAEWTGWVVEYLRGTDPRAQRKLLRKIEKHPRATPARVAEALPQIVLWTDQPAGSATLDFAIGDPPTRGAEILRAQVRVPEGYDPERAYPVLLGLHAADQDSAAFIRFLAALLGKSKDDYIITALANLPGAWLSDPPAAASAPRAWLGALGKRYHVDTDRVYLAGYGPGGHAAASLAMLHADAFAGVLVLAGTCLPDVGGEAVELFLGNLRHLPTLIVHGAGDAGGGESESKRDEPAQAAARQVAEIAAWNRYLADRAARAHLPITVMEIPNAGRDGITPPAEALAQLLAHQRPRDPRHVTHLFRYPPQGRAYWLRQTRYDGQPWSAQQIVISPGQDESRADAVAAVLREKLAHFTGTIDGQTVRIEAHGSSRFDVLLGDHLLDLDTDIEILVNGTRRFAGRAQPRVATLLDEARRTGDLKRPVSVRFQVSPKGRAVPY